MRFGVHVPNFGDFHDLRAIASLAHEAEESGWDGFFIWDHILYAKTKRPVIDPWIALAAIAMRTERIRFGPLEAAKTLTPPSFLGATPPPRSPYDTVLTRGQARFFGPRVQPSRTQDDVRGMPGSRGLVTGVARVVRNLDEARMLRSGEILVAITTMPSWTPLFALAAAVVTETGGPLSHCAIVAREYGIPAVVGLPGATDIIRTGQSLTVDGAHGVITIED